MRLTVADLGPDDHFDYCVVGTGPAGITCATSLAAAGARVALLEGGGEEYSERSQQLYQGEVVGDPYFALDAARLRYLGGTSNHWAGWCRQLDKFDFQTKGDFENTGWPINKDALDPYMQKASGILEIPKIPDDRHIAGSGLAQIHFVWSTPVSFATAFAHYLGPESDIFLVLQANVIGLTTNGSATTGVQVIDTTGLSRTVRADRYILATGGIENSRLLLWSNLQSNGQLIKRPDVLGKYWMEHPHFGLGDAILRSDVPFAMGVDPDRAFFGPTPTAMTKHGILNCGLRFQRVNYYGTRRIIADVACVAPEWGMWAMRQLGRNLVCGVALRAAWEQEPRAANRIELSEERDALGVPRPRLYWRKSENDRRTARVTAKLFGEYLAREDLGRVRLRPWLLEHGEFPVYDELGGYHHMGGTRMGTSPEDGVVDSNCKVFGQSNLYIAGSSVFPSCGHANPTLTIVQLALRLSDHLLTTQL